MIVSEDIYRKIFYKLIGYEKAITRIKWSTNGDMLASCSEEDQTIKVWDIYNPANSRAKKFSDDAPMTMTWSPDDRKLAFGTRNGKIIIFSLNNKKIIKKFKAHDQSILCMTWSPTGNFLASGSQDKTIAIWDT